MRNKQYWLNWAKAAGVRAAKTMAQTAMSLISVGAVMSDIDWLTVASASIVAGIYSLLTNIAGLPEVETVEFANDDAEFEGDEINE